VNHILRNLVTQTISHFPKVDQRISTAHAPVPVTLTLILNRMADLEPEVNENGSEEDSNEETKEPSSKRPRLLWLNGKKVTEQTVSEFVDEKEELYTEQITLMFAVLFQLFDQRLNGTVFDLTEKVMEYVEYDAMHPWMGGQMNKMQWDNTMILDKL